MKTARKRREKVALAVHVDQQQIYVRLDSSGINPMVAITDGLPLAFFGKTKAPYLRVERALEWFENEHRNNPGNRKYEEAIADYRRVLEKFQNGEVEEA